MSNFDSNSVTGLAVVARADGLIDAFSVPSAHVIAALKADLKECGKTRNEVAAELSERWQQTTVAMLDAFIATSKPHRFPAEAIPAWTLVTGSRRLLDVLAAEVGLSIATAEDRKFAELGRAQLKSKKLAEELWERA
jgi:hypothetical protein